ncbi:MAG: hypothetical protein MK108_06575 [Mariniblastus sp.]|nr:hypothetical protein [Mariniblastus sp.]
MKQTRPDWTRLFPLRLTSMERFHLLDDNPGYYNGTFAKFEFEGELDPQLAQQALDLAIHRHPLVHARVESDGSRLNWVRVPDFQLPVDWQREATDYGPTRRIDIFREPGVHVYVGSDRDSKFMLFHGHHTTCDGIGGVQFTTDWLTIYDNLVHQREPFAGLPRLDPGMLPQRNKLRMFSRRYLKHLWKQPVGLFGAVKFIFRKIRPLYPVPESLPESLPDWQPDAQPAITGTWLDVATTANLRKHALDRQVAFNTLLMSEFFLCLQDWRVEELAQTGDDWIRLIVPMSIRDLSDRRQSAINRATIVQVDRQRKDFQDRDRFLARLDREIAIIRGWQLSKIFLLAIRAMAATPGMLARSSASRKCRGTAVYTNLSEPIGRLGLPRHGDSFAAGNLRIKSFDYAGPIRPGTPIYLAIQKHLERTRVSMHYDPRVIVASQAEKLLSSYIKRLKALATSGDGNLD